MENFDFETNMGKKATIISGEIMLASPVNPSLALNLPNNNSLLAKIHNPPFKRFLKTLGACLLAWGLTQNLSVAMNFLGQNENLKSPPNGRMASGLCAFS